MNVKPGEIEARNKVGYALMDLASVCDAPKEVWLEFTTRLKLDANGEAIFKDFTLQSEE